MNITLSAFLIWSSLNLTEIQKEIKNVYKKVLPNVVTLIYSNSIGGGVVYDSTGLIVSSLPFPHVKRYKIVDSKGDTNFAEILYWDEFTHLAFLKSGLKLKHLRKTKNAEEGDFAIIVGNSSGIERSLMLSIVSKKSEKRIYLQGNLSPGQIGSPVFNINGEFMGVVRGKLIEFEERNFPFFFSKNSNLISVIPWNVVDEISERIGEGKFKVPGWLGILIKNAGEGVLIKKVFPGSPAEKANLKEGDIILEVESKRIKDIKVLLNKIKEFSPGENLRLKIKRQGNLITKEVKLGERPSFFPY